MKTILLLSAVILLVSYEYGIQANDSITYRQVRKSKKLELAQHLLVLDSVMRSNPNDTVYYCCLQSINFIVRKTGIEVSTDANFIGRTSFSKSDFARWQMWYKKRYESRKKDQQRLGYAANLVHGCLGYAAGHSIRSIITTLHLRL